MLGILSSDNRLLTFFELEELYSIAVEVIDSNGKCFQGQVKIYLLDVLSVSQEDKVEYCLCYYICLGLRYFFFILLYHLIWITHKLLFYLSFELLVSNPILLLELIAIIFDL